MFNWFKKSPAKEKRDPPPRLSYFSTHALEVGVKLRRIGDTVRELIGMAPKVKTVGAQDDDDSISQMKQAFRPGAGMPEVLGMWYASQTFIGYQFAAILAQHWLINKACTMPGRDAVRQGFEIVAQDGKELSPEALKTLRRFDKAYRLNWNLEQFIRMGRIFGVRVALFKVESTDTEYYEKPFNIDGVTPGSYKGIVQVDPYWIAPELDQAASSQPDTKHFYEPTWWIINGRRHHRTHLIIFRNADVPDLLKPAYMYGGVPVPQQIMERVYAAERVANEAPQLAQTKRTTIWQTDMGAFVAKGDEAITALEQWVQYRDNYGIKLGDKEGDEFAQFDTSLADLDSVIMTQYQIVAAAANVPATKLLGTTPKGFNATGEYETKSYHEELESIQTHDLTPFVERHHALVWKSEIEPKGGEPPEITVEWNPLDTPTAKELAETNLSKAQTGAALVQSGAIASEDERKRIALDKSSGYHGIAINEMPEEVDPDEDEDGNGTTA